MYNLYHGNSGRAQRMPENISERQHMPSGRRGANSQHSSDGKSGSDRRQCSRDRPDLIRQLASGLLQKLAELETEDMILLLMLYLMYRDSGDAEFLIIMGAMFLL